MSRSSHNPNLAVPVDESSSQRTGSKGVSHSSHAGERIIDWSLLWRRIVAGVRRLWVAVQFRALSSDIQLPGWSRKLRLSWFKLGLAAIVFFVFTQKEIQFSVRMKAPAAGTVATTATTASANQMSVIQTAFGGSSSQGFSPAALNEAAVRNYISRFERVARTEQQKYHIPASVKLAMAIVESRGGTLAEATEQNNHFGGRLRGNFYESAWANWRAHSQLLTNNWPQLAEHAGNYRSYLKALSATDYATDQTYTEHLRDIISTYALAQLDEQEL